MRRKLFFALTICFFIVQAGWAQTPAESSNDSRVCRKE
jgi:hypothetical protein